jgi:hypothetical protein
MAREQGTQAGAKADTAYYAEAGGAGIHVDLSQEFTDLTVSAPGAYESPSPRAQLTTERTVFARWVANAADANAGLLIHGNTAQTNYTWLLGINGAMTLFGGQNGGPVWTAAAAIVSGKDYCVSWSVRPNPDTTGAGDALISEFLIWNHTDSAIVEIGQTTHAVPVTGAWDLTIGGWWNGAGITFAPTNAPTIVRVSRAHHPITEVASDLVAARSPYTGTANDGPTEPIGPIPIASTMGDPGYFAGRHPWGYAAAHSRLAARRAWSLLVNDVYSDAQAVGSEPANWRRAAPGDENYLMSIQWLRWVPVPAEATHAWCRAHVLTSTAGARGLRVYAMNRPPDLSQIGAEPAPSLEVFHATVSWTAGAGAEEGWREFGYVKLPVFSEAIPGWAGTVHLCLAYLDAMPGSTTVDAFHARPAQRWTPGGFDD